MTYFGKASLKYPNILLCSHNYDRDLIMTSPGNPVISHNMKIIIIMVEWHLLTWLATSDRETQSVCNLMLPHEDDILNKFEIWNERHLQVRKPYQLPGWTKNWD